MRLNWLSFNLRTPAGRGFWLIALTSAAAGFAMAGHGAVVSNYFQQELGLSGPQFGYITAIREIPGFLLILLTALFYRVPLPRLTAGALGLLTIGYGFFGWSWSFWSVAPWVVLSSIGYHTWLQTQYALALSLTTEHRSGSVLGLISGINSGGSLIAMLVMLLAFELGWLDFRGAFVLCGAFAFVAAVSIVGFPELVNGTPKVVVREREPIVLRREYIYYYLLNLLDGGRQQILFSFGLWVLVSRFELGVPAISAILIAVTALNTLLGPRIGRMFDSYGEKPMLAVVNVAYVVVLAGYAFANHVAAAVAFYIIYSLIFPLSGIGAATYLRKVAVQDEIAPSLAMGVTLQHMAAIVVPLATGYVLNFIGYQIPFLIAAGFASLTFLVTRRLDPQRQRSPRRIAEDAPAPTQA